MIETVKLASGITTPVLENKILETTYVNSTWTSTLNK